MTAVATQSALIRVGQNPAVVRCFAKRRAHRESSFMAVIPPPSKGPASLVQTTRSHLHLTGVHNLSEAFV